MSAIETATEHSLAALRREIAARGIGRPAGVRSFGKFLLFLGVASGALALIAWVGPPWWAIVPIAVVGSWFLTAAAMCGHDGAHGTASSVPALNSLLAELAFALLGGLSVGYWKHKHNVGHHPHVNLAREDPDVEQSPLAMSARQHRGHGKPVKLLQRHVQAVAFWALGAPLVGFALRRTSVQYLLRELHARRHVHQNLVDLTWIVAHYVAWIVVPCVVVGWRPALITYGVTTVLIGVFLTTIFAPAHMPYPLVARSTDPFMLQLASTRDFRTNFFFEFTLVGLNYQIEHHVAQGLNHFDLARAAPVVREYCEKHSLPYHETRWGRALMDTTRQIQHAWHAEEVVI
jgi:fatty acid desaturase